MRKGHELKELLKNAVFMSFALIGLGCLAKIKMNVEKIESKLKALLRIIQQIKKGSKSQ